MLCFPLSPSSPAPPTAPSEPLLCKFADGGQKKRQTQVKYPQNGRAWTREGEVSHKRVINHKEGKNKKRPLVSAWPLIFFQRWQHFSNLLVLYFSYFIADGGRTFWNMLYFSLCGFLILRRLCRISSAVKQSSRRRSEIEAFFSIAPCIL